MHTAQPLDLKKVISWSLYDWANSAFSTTVMAGFFPVFFKEYWSAGADVSLSTFQLGAANSSASAIIAVLAPMLGAIADRGGGKRKLLLLFCLMGIITTGSLYFVQRGEWHFAAILYAFALIGFSGANIFYDSLLIHVSKSERIDFVSALGYSMGYLGGGLLFALNVFMVLSPKTFGLADTSQAIRASFVSVAVWWAVFSVPLFLFVKEPKRKSQSSGWGAVRAGLRQLSATLCQASRLRVVLLFLLGYWFYIDALDTIIRMAVDYGLSLGFTSKSLLMALLLTQFIGFPAAVAFGYIGQKLGPKTGIYIGISVYLAVTVWAFFLRSEREFYALAVAIGLVQGGVQSLSRSLYTRIIPRDKAGEFFGLYNMLGKFAAIVGPFLMGLISFYTCNPRYSIFAISLLFILGGAILYFVDVEKGRQLAANLENF